MSSNVSDRLTAVLRSAGVVPPRFDDVQLVVDVPLRQETLRCCVVALGDDFTGRDLSPLRERPQKTDRTLPLLTAILVESGLLAVPASGPYQAPALSGEAAAAPSREEASAVVEGNDPKHKDAVLQLFSRLADVLEVALYSSGAAGRGGLEAEYQWCVSVEGAVFERQADIFSKACTLLPAGMHPAHRARARRAMGSGGSSVLATGSLPQLKQQTMLLSSALRDCLQTRASAPRPPAAAGTSILPPAQLAARLNEWRHALSDLTAAANTATNLIQRAGLSAPKHSSVHDAVGDLACAIHDQNASLAAVQHTSADVRREASSRRLEAERGRYAT
ncbi:hypothetical protein DIPPA_33605 [Diplonema papillatum]|nr:hypothetical protein DIPPA_33605 [Diplonema papillatum]